MAADRLDFGGLAGSSPYSCHPSPYSTHASFHRYVSISVFSLLPLAHSIPHFPPKTASTLSNLLSELVQARQKLVSIIPSLGVRAGCQLFERFVGFSGAGTVSFCPFLSSLIGDRISSFFERSVGRLGLSIA